MRYYIVILMEESGNEFLCTQWSSSIDKGICTKMPIIVHSCLISPLQDIVSLLYHRMMSISFKNVETGVGEIGVLTCLAERQ